MLNYLKKLFIQKFKLIKIKFYFKPLKRKILIYDENGSKYIISYLNENSYQILYTRNEKISLLIIFFCICKFKLSHAGYIDEFIRYAKPKIIMTFIDNNINFYNLKKNFPFKKIFIQNGLRTAFRDIFFYTHDKNLKNQNYFKNKKLYVDYMLVWNNYISKLYKDFICGECIPIGSFRNNMLKKKILTNNKKILFISNYKIIYDKIYTKNEKQLLLNLRDYCIKNKLELNVLGKNIDFAKKEKEYFSKILSSSFFKFIPGTSERDTYSIASKYNVIVTIESSLGYEMLIRKKKVAFFNTHENTHPINTLYFGWPRKKAISGPFWSNKFNQNEIKRILDYLIAINNEEWNRIRELNSKNLINLDNNNNKFIQLMKKEGMKDCLNLLN